MVDSAARDRAGYDSRRPWAGTFPLENSVPLHGMAKMRTKAPHWTPELTVNVISIPVALTFEALVIGVNDTLLGSNHSRAHSRHMLISVSYPGLPLTCLDHLKLGTRKPEDTASTSPNPLK